MDRYLSASGFLGETARPFFVALPKGERGTHALATETAEDFRHKIAATDKQVTAHATCGVTRAGAVGSNEGSQHECACLRVYLRGHVSNGSWE